MFLAGSSETASNGFERAVAMDLHNSVMHSRIQLPELPGMLSTVVKGTLRSPSNFCASAKIWIWDTGSGLRT